MNKQKLIDSLDVFTLGYIECMLWSSTDESTPSGGHPLDDNYNINNLTIKALIQCRDDCTDFQESNTELLAQAGNAGRNGHDFWLTRNGHGAGFWDRGYPDKVGKGLTDASKVYGSVNPYTHKGKIHI